jgi:hypothetical protein
VKEYLNKDPLVLVFLFVVIIALFIFVPLIVIWSLNTLFPVLSIPYNFYTWISTIIVGAFLRSNTAVEK